MIERWPGMIIAPLTLGAICLPALANARDVPVIPSYPREVSLVDEGAEGYVYLQSDTSLPLYTYGRDALGKSNCNDACAAAWPPVTASPDAVPIGDWTVIARSDGSGQWALKGQPIYVRLHDDLDEPTGEGIGGVWHVLPHMRYADELPVP